MSTEDRSEIGFPGVPLSDVPDLERVRPIRKMKYKTDKTTKLSREYAHPSSQLKFKVRLKEQ